MTTTLPILIFGAGLAGLSLGQALKHANIPLRIFERDQAASFRAQGYRIRINQQGGDALKRLLPDHLFQQFEDTCANVVSGGHSLDAFTLTEIQRPGMPPQLGRNWNADRTVLRNLLLTGLEENITFDSKLQRYEITSRDVAAHFTDGSVVHGSLLIGADGINSIVRRQLIPDHLLLDTQGRAIFGKTPITQDTFTTLPQQLNDGITLIIAPSEPRIKLFCDVMHFNRESATTTVIDLPQDYIYWVLVYHTSVITSPDTNPLTLTRTWHPTIQSVMHPYPSSQPLHFHIAKPPLTPWPIQALITLLGDAAHPMPPVGGVGANLAFQDAADLFETIRDPNWVAKRGLAGYEETMRTRGNEALLMSAGGATRFFGMRGLNELHVVE